MRGLDDGPDGLNEAAWERALRDLGRPKPRRARASRANPAPIFRIVWIQHDESEVYWAGPGCGIDGWTISLNEALEFPSRDDADAALRPARRSAGRGQFVEVQS